MPTAAGHFNGLYILFSILVPSISFISLLDHAIDSELDGGLTFTTDVIYIIVGSLIGFIFYSILAFFLDMVIPGEYGNAVSPLNALKKIKNWITSVLYINFYFLFSLTFFLITSFMFMYRNILEDQLIMNY